MTGIFDIVYNIMNIILKSIIPKMSKNRINLKKFKFVIFSNVFDEFIFSFGNLSFSFYPLIKYYALLPTVYEANFIK